MLFTEKKCSKCNITQPLVCFYKEKCNKDGHQRYCKECSKNSNKHFYKNKKHPPANIANKCCSSCKQTKPTADFSTSVSSKDGWQQYCKKCVSLKGKKWRKDNPNYSKILYERRTEEQKIRYSASSKLWRRNNPEKYKSSYTNWQKTNKQKHYEHTKKSRKKQYRNNPTLRITMALRTRLYQALKGVGRSGCTMDLLGCDLNFFKNHISLLFVEGMSWENYGKWHLDHIKPCSSFDLSQEKQQKQCFHYTNFQPLWSEENIRKSDKLDWIRFP